MGSKRMGPDPRLSRFLRDLLGLDYFVETGTYMGDTAAWAITSFKYVVSIELSAGLYRQAQRRFEKVPNLTLLHGSSPEQLLALGAVLTPSLFWLDAHWSGGVTAGEGYECPLLDELRSIGHLAAKSAVMIDDARLFLAPPPPPHNAAAWPTLSTVVDVLREIGLTAIHIVDDVIVAVPESAGPMIAAYLRSSPDDFPRSATLDPTESGRALCTDNDCLLQLLRSGRHVLAIGGGGGHWAAAVARVAPKSSVHVCEGPWPDARDLEALRGVSHLSMVYLGPDTDLRAAWDALEPWLAKGRIDALTCQVLSLPSFFGLELAGAGFRPFKNADSGGTTAQIWAQARLTRFLTRSTVKMPPIEQVCRDFQIKTRGVLHIGAHEGREVAAYRACGFSPIILVEANPELGAKLMARFGSDPDVKVVVAAATDKAGPVTLNITSMDQSSSLLPLGRHLEIYPSIQVMQTVEVRGVTVDQILAECQIPVEDISLINIDIQGAELMALSGAGGVLMAVEAVYSEVNFDELYQGGADISQLDDLLQASGLKRVLTVCPYHPSWGDALYLRATARVAHS